MTDTSTSADVSPKVNEDVRLSDDLDDGDKTAGRLLATALHGQDVVPEHRILFRVRLSLTRSVTATGSH